MTALASIIVVVIVVIVVIAVALFSFSVSIGYGAALISGSVAYGAHAWATRALEGYLVRLALRLRLTGVAGQQTRRRGWRRRRSCRQRFRRGLSGSGRFMGLNTRDDRHSDDQYKHR
jgi:hypothetical protein